MKTVQKKNKTHIEIRKATGSQLGFLKRNLNLINRLSDSYQTIPLNPQSHKYPLVLSTFYAQQKAMYSKGVHRIDDRIACITLVLNLVKLAGMALLSLLVKLLSDLPA